MLSFSSTSSTLNILINRGNLVTTGNSSSGLSVFGSGNTLINDGSISTAGANAAGVFANGSSNALTNNGTIDVSGTNTHGITWEAASRDASTIAVTSSHAGRMASVCFLAMP
jgi:hypothetical protein